MHIGRAKTGTSALQKFFFENIEILEKKGIKYLQTGLFYNTHHPLSWCLFKEAFEKGNGTYWKHARKYAVLDRKEKQYWFELRKEIEESKCKKFLISSEEFGVVRDIKSTSELLRKYLSGLDVRIIVYFRRQDDFLQSLFHAIRIR